ncbi:MAG: 4-(cytidine 5'-diphospho)-2-C-methyl-D-erythritol kinase [Odoribacteraceae bacterium]|jgi:4-diphosphocytidyl-2-C-methyl-D-erythritol kinase|nr:4-(cytidine 5'-diphospho)-2-C-methyl-D-erythritol kinase [Odoribacteraceae bacterium]
MILYPHAKINVGLFVTGRRPDGFHDIETILYPVALRDVLEINLVAGRGECFLRCTGGDAGAIADNLVARAYRLLAKEFDLPSTRVHLHKLIPAGAGLGGGSADGAFALKGLDALCGLKLGEERLREYAARLGSDCPFFISGQPVAARGRGEVMEPVDLSLEAYRVVVVKPPRGISTAMAYREVSPRAARADLSLATRRPVEQWEGVENCFEEVVAARVPEVREIKERLLEAGAAYASMTGSGSAVYGLFKHPVDARALFPGYFAWQSDGNPVNDI